MTSLFDSLFGHVSHGRRSGFLARLNNAMALYRSRSRLAELEPHMLNDIGLSRHDAAREASRPVWDAPNTWKS